MEVLIAVAILVGIIFLGNASSNQPQIKPLKPTPLPPSNPPAARLNEVMQELNKPKTVEQEIVNKLQQLVCRGELMYVNMMPFDMMMFKEWQNSTNEYLMEHMPKVTRTPEMLRLVQLMVQVEAQAKAEKRSGHYTMESLAETFEHYKKAHGFKNMTNPFKS